MAITLETKLNLFSYAVLFTILRIHYNLIISICKKIKRNHLFNSDLRSVSQRFVIIQRNIKPLIVTQLRENIIASDFCRKRPKSTKTNTKRLTTAAISQHHKEPLHDNGQK